MSGCGYLLKRLPRRTWHFDGGELKDDDISDDDSDDGDEEDSEAEEEEQQQVPTPAPATAPQPAPAPTAVLAPTAAPADPLDVSRLSVLPWWPTL